MEEVDVLASVTNGEAEEEGAGEGEVDEGSEAEDGSLELFPLPLEEVGSQLS